MSKERSALQAELDASVRNSSVFATRLLDAQIAITNRDTRIASAEEKFNRIRVALTNTQTEKYELIAVIKNSSLLHRSELNDQIRSFQDQLRKIGEIVSDQNVQIEDLKNERAKLAEKLEDVVKSVVAHEGARQDMEAQIDSQSKHISLLEYWLKAERSTSDRKLCKLMTELHRGREESYFADAISMTAREQTIPFAPKLAAPRDRTPSASAGRRII